MRTKVYFAAFVAAVFIGSGCSQNEVLEGMNNAPKAIGFDTYTGKSVDSRTGTGSKVNYREALGANGDAIGVFAIYNQEAASQATTLVPNMMNNQEVTYSTSDPVGWSYSPLKYWPQSGTVDFYAYYPYNKDNAYTDTREMGVIDFTQSTGWDNQTDLMWAQAKGVKDPNNTANSSQNTITDGKVKLEFNHALSRIAFSATSGLSETDAKTTKFVVTNIVFGGDNKLKKTGKMNITGTTVGWSEQAEFTETTDDMIFTWSSSDLISTDNVLDSKVKQLTNTDKYALIIPFDYTVSTKIDIPVKVTYTVYTTSKTELPENFISSTSTDGTITSYTNTATGTVSHKFEAGNAYLINFKVTPNAIQFTAVMSQTGWGTEQNVGDTAESGK